MADRLTKLEDDERSAMSSTILVGVLACVIIFVILALRG
jgi:type IV secretory pathway component VirB8